MMAAKKLVKKVLRYTPMEMVNGHVAPLSRRVAHFLDWAARHDPYSFYRPQVIAREVYQYGRTLSPESQETKAVKSALEHAKRILRDDYGRGFTSQRSVGVRACVDSEDTVRHDLSTKARRKRSIEQSILETGTKAVRPGEFSSTADGKMLRSFHKDLMDIVDPDATQKILDQASRLLTSGR